LTRAKTVNQWWIESELYILRGQTYIIMINIYFFICFTHIYYVGFQILGLLQIFFLKKKVEVYKVFHLFFVRLEGTSFNFLR